MAAFRSLRTKVNMPTLSAALPPPAPRFNQFVPPYPVKPGQSGKPYMDGWDVKRATDEGYNRSVWVARAVDTIATNAARLQTVFRADDRWSGPMLTNHPLLNLFNDKASPYEKSFIWRKRLSQQILLNRQGAMVEVIRNNMGDPIALYLLPAGYTWPIPNEDTFVSAYRVQLPGKGWFDVPTSSVIWLRSPHPVDPYSGMTPLEAAGIDIEIDWYARLYNRNFMLNDARPGGLLVLQGEIGDDDAIELRKRFAGPTGWGPSGAGRVSVIEGDDAQFVDTGATPRDAAYVEARTASKEAILAAFGIDESIIADTSGRTYDNAGVAQENFWRETMIPHLTLIASGLEDLDPDPVHFLSFNLDDIAILQRDSVNKKTFMLKEVAGGTRSPDEYRIAAGEEPRGGAADDLYFLTTFAPIEGASPTADAEIAAINANLVRLTSAVTAGNGNVSGSTAQLAAPIPEADRPDGLDQAGLMLTEFKDAQGRDMGMVALFPPDNVAATLALYGTELANELHVSLAIFDRTGASVGKMNALRACVVNFAQTEGPLDMRIAGLGRFHNPGGTDVIWAAIDSVGLTEMHDRLVAALGVAGWSCLSEHGYTPHLTLSFVPADTAAEVMIPQTMEWVQDQITLALDDGSSMDVPLGNLVNAVAS